MTTTAKHLVPHGAMLSIPTCQATRTDGEPCAAPVGEAGFCFWHDPQRRAETVTVGEFVTLARALTAEG